jgi:hypothetical protein
MPWFRLDDSFHSHPKIMAAGNEAIGLYVRCGTYAAQHSTDGFIPEQLALQYGTPKLAETLVRAKLWRRVRGGWRMPDYLDYNPSKEAVDKDRKAAAERQRRRREGISSRRDNAVTHGVSHTTPSRPVPVDPVVDVVNRANGSSNGHASPETIEAIIKEILDVTGRHISDDWAARIWREQFAERHPANPVAYVRQAIRNDPNPRQRFLPLY